MKFLSPLFLLLMFFASAVQSQNITLHKPEKNYELSYLAHFGAIDGNLMIIEELNFKVIFKEKIGMGLFGQVSWPPVGPKFVNWEDSEAKLLLGGFCFDYYLSKDIYPEISLYSRAGWGMLLMAEGNLAVSSFALGVNTGFSLTRLLKLNLGLGYHIENPLDLYIEKDGFLSGPEATIGLKLRF